MYLVSTSRSLVASARGLRGWAPHGVLQRCSTLPKSMGFHRIPTFSAPNLYLLHLSVNVTSTRTRGSYGCIICWLSSGHCCRVQDPFMFSSIKSILTCLSTLVVNLQALSCFVASAMQNGFKWLPGWCFQVLQHVCIYTYIHIKLTNICMYVYIHI